MRASEILRKLADVIDAKEGGQEQAIPTEIKNRPDVVDVEVSEPTDTTEIENQTQVNVKTMVPPLQQKIDLMKKLAGMETGNIEVGGDNAAEVCPTCNCTPCGCNADSETEDEMSIMKRNAGIKPVVIAMADEDEPFDG